jgi:hypothetical protein
MRRLALGLIPDDPCNCCRHRKHGAKPNALLWQKALVMAFLRPFDRAKFRAHDAAENVIAGTS